MESNDVTMTQYEIERELDSLYSDYEIACNDPDFDRVCRIFSTDTRQEAIDAIEEEIEFYELQLGKLEQYSSRELNYERTADNPYLCW